MSFKPLFAGLDESGMATAASGALAEAKFDFECARNNQPPRYACLMVNDLSSGAKTYQGRGYRLTTFGGGPRHRVGQKIEMEPAITGGRPYSYDESFERWD